MNHTEADMLATDNRKLLGELGVLKKRFEAASVGEKVANRSLAQANEWNAKLQRRVVILEQALRLALDEIEHASIDGDVYATDVLMAGEAALHDFKKD